MKKIFLGNLSFTATEDMVRSLFEKYGPVERVNIITKGESGRPRGFGFVEMSNDAEAVKAINALNDTDLEGRTLSVHEARLRTDRPTGLARMPCRFAILASPFTWRWVIGTS